MTTTKVPAARLAPDWLLATDVALCPCGCIGKRRKGGYVAKTLTGVANVVRQAMFSDDVADRSGCAPADRCPRQGRCAVRSPDRRGVRCTRSRCSARCTWVRSCSRSRVASRSECSSRRVWLFVPIFTGIVVLPATLSLITPGEIVVPLGTWFGTAVGLTAEGLESAGLIVTRVALSISLVVLLTLTTQWSRLLAALRSLFVPTTVILVLSMSYRYLFHLLTSVDDMYTARRAANRRRRIRRRVESAVRGRVRGRAVRQGPRDVGRGLPGDGVAWVHRQRAHVDAAGTSGGGTRCSARCACSWPLLVLWGDHAIR